MTGAGAISSIVDVIGNTPLIRLPVPEEARAKNTEIWGKCEFANPGGSVKDRAAYQIIKDALADGRLRKDATLIDSTSGNTGVAYSLIGSALGIKIALVMPENVSAARKQITTAFGTELIYSSPMEGSDGAICMVRDLVEKNPGKYFYPDQYSNPSNARAHYLGTAPEIIGAVGDKITHFVAGIGTTGTIMGAGMRLKEHRASIRIVAIEPDDALHGLEGLKHMASSLVPELWKPEACVDEILPVSTDEAWDISEVLVRDAGLFVGHSAGAAIAGAMSLAKTADPESCIVAILPDRGDRYFRPLKWERQFAW